jgi:hypothetical protein
MGAGTHRCQLLLTTVRVIAPVVCLLLCVCPSTNANSTSQVFIKDNISLVHKQELVKELRKITGWSKLSFTDDGRLSIENADALQGSKTARSLLTSAVSGDKLIVLEDASSRADVAFCRVVPGRWPNESALHPPAFVVLIDFIDFEQIVGDKQARASFHVGWGLLHELDHVVSDTIDSETEGDLGECEMHINKMREEVGLPVRASYFFTASPLKTNPNFHRRFVRLPFDQRDVSSNRTKRYWLTWDSTIVGGLANDNQSAAVRALVGQTR